MAATATALTTKFQSGSPYQLDPIQVLHASSALLKHIKESSKEKAKTSGKQNLLTGADGGEDSQVDEMPIWLNLTTKRHIIDQKRLKPAKITLPHSLNASPTINICLITADPQRTYKDIVASPAFSAELRTRITRVIGVKKIKAKYNQYEAQRQLLSEHDVFLADDRIITRLPKLLGKTFYKATTKRPVPISMQGPAPKLDGKRVARAKGDNAAKDNISPQKLVTEINKTLATALIALSPSTLTSVRIGLAGWPSQKIAENIEAVSNELITRFVPQKWKNVRALHIKGPLTMALPIWLTHELWVDEDDIVAENPTEAKVITSSETPNVGKKRKAVDNEEDSKLKKSKKVKKSKREDKAKNVETVALSPGNDDNLDKEIAMRKESLKKQKAEAVASVEGETPKSKVDAVGKKKKKSKTAIVEA